MLTFISGLSISPGRGIGDRHLGRGTRVRARIPSVHASENDSAGAALPGKKQGKGPEPLPPSVPDPFPSGGQAYRTTCAGDPVARFEISCQSVISSLLDAGHLLLQGLVNPDVLEPELGRAFAVVVLDPGLPHPVDVGRRRRDEERLAEDVGLSVLDDLVDRRRSPR